MAEVNASFELSAEKRVLSIIEKIMESIEDVGMYGLESEFDEESGNLKITADAVDLEGVCGWMTIIQKAFNENGMGPFSIKAKGAVDNDYYAYTAFEILCNNQELKIRETDFDAEPSEEDEVDDDYEWIMEYEEKEAAAFKKIAKEEFRKIDESDIYYNDDEFDAAVDVLEDNADFDDSEEDFDEE